MSIVILQRIRIWFLVCTSRWLTTTCYSSFRESNASGLRGHTCLCPHTSPYTDTHTETLIKSKFSSPIQENTAKSNTQQAGDVTDKPQLTYSKVAQFPGVRGKQVSTSQLVSSSPGHSHSPEAMPFTQGCAEECTKEAELQTS